MFVTLVDEPCHDRTDRLASLYVGTRTQTSSLSAIGDSRHAASKTCGSEVTHRLAAIGRQSSGPIVDGARSLVRTVLAQVLPDLSATTAVVDVGEMRVLGVGPSFDSDSSATAVSAICCSSIVTNLASNYRRRIHIRFGLLLYGPAEVPSMTGRADDVFDLLGLTEYEETALEELISLGKRLRRTSPKRPESRKRASTGCWTPSPTAVSSRSSRDGPNSSSRNHLKRSSTELSRTSDRSTSSSRPNWILAARRSSPSTTRCSSARPSPSPDVGVSFHVVDVGDPSERETRRIYDDAEEELLIMSKSFEYFDSVRPAFETALDRGLDVTVPSSTQIVWSDENREIQTGIVTDISESYPKVGVRFSEERLPWRGTVADPSMEYDSGRRFCSFRKTRSPTTCARPLSLRTAPSSPD